MSSVAEKKGQAVKDALAKTDDVRPAVTTEENEELKQYSKALLEQAIEIGKDNEHYDKYNFVQLPYAKLQNGSEHHEHVGIYFASRATSAWYTDALLCCCRLHSSHRWSILRTVVSKEFNP